MASKTAVLLATANLSASLQRHQPPTEEVRTRSTCIRPDGTVIIRDFPANWGHKQISREIMLAQRHNSIMFIERINHEKPS